MQKPALTSKAAGRPFRMGTRLQAWLGFRMPEPKGQVGRKKRDSKDNLLLGCPDQAAVSGKRTA